MAASSTTKPAPAGAGSRLQEVDHPGQGIDSVNTENNPTRQHWRDRLPVHPAAELLPLMSKDELRELADDIKRNGLREPARILFDPKHRTYTLLDGRNRLDALELDGVELFHNGKLSSFFQVSGVGDPVAYVISKNIRRRHLTSEQKRKLIAKLLKLNPEKSNLQIAKTVGANDKTVASVRADPRSEIPNVATRTDTKGRKQPAAKTIKVKVSRTTIPIVAPCTVVESGGPPKVVNLAITPEDSAEQRKQVNAALEAVPDGASKADKESARWLCEFKYACEHYLPKMTAADRQAAVAYTTAYSAKIDKAAP
jgi:hypothetical protein